MSCRVTDNLQCYLHEARLPDMHYSPAVANKMEPLSTGLDVHPRRYRRLEVVHVIDTQLLYDMILDWTQNYIPSTSISVDDEDEKTGERFTVPCKPRFSVPSLPLGRVNDIDRVSLCMDNFPLESVQRTMHLLYPDYRSWRFAFCDESSAEPYFRRFSWSQLGCTESGKRKQVNQMLTMLLFSPWTLSEEELQNFIRPQIEWLWSKVGAELQLELFLCSHVLKVWDVCFSNGCRWFVVSTYTHWVFGVFSTEWMEVFVSPLYKHDSCSPTILEVLGFWVVSAMECEGGWVPPEGRNGHEFNMQHLSATVMDISVDILKALRVANYE
ncbi:hypothetical protein J3A83DRAFT_4096468 [Scleroderma citrinum]